MRNNLNLFLDNLKEIYPADYTKVIKGLKKTRHTTFRINITKSNEEEVTKNLRDKGFHFVKGLLPNSHIIKKHPENIRISETNCYNAGKIYIQELSSMIPPIILNPKPHEIILDIAAAPGSKTTQLAALANNKSKILAIEKHPLRIKILHHNLALQGSQNIKVIQGNGIKFDKRNPQFINFFDKALVDAPCSSEGRFNLNNPKSYKYWNINKRKDMSKIQKGLLISSVRMLKPGGKLVYSTCTFGVEENELVIDWLLQKIPDLKVEKINLPLTNVKTGIIKWRNKQLNKQIVNCKRIIPNEIFSGFFIASIKKPD